MRTGKDGIEASKHRSNEATKQRSLGDAKAAKQDEFYTQLVTPTDKSDDPLLVLMSDPMHPSWDGLKVANAEVVRDSTVAAGHTFVGRIAAQLPNGEVDPFAGRP